MTIGITGPRHRAPWRGVVVVLIIAAIVLSICLILLGLTGDFLVDWLWFSTIGYLYAIGHAYPVAKSSNGVTIAFARYGEGSGGYEQSAG